MRKQKSTAIKFKMMNEVPIINPRTHDVLSGRGNFANKHAGNIRFRQLVANAHEKYITSEFRVEKVQIASQIIDEIRSTNPPGRFLTKDGSGTSWTRISDKKVVDKVRQRLREHGNRYSGKFSLSSSKDYSESVNEVPNSEMLQYSTMNSPAYVALPTNDQNVINRAEERKRFGTFMSKSVHDLDDGISAEVEKMNAMEKLKTEMVFLNKKYREIELSLNPIDLALMKRAKIVKQNNSAQCHSMINENTSNEVSVDNSIRTVPTKSFDSDESINFWDTKDYSLRNNSTRKDCNSQSMENFSWRDMSIDETDIEK